LNKLGSIRIGPIRFDLVSRCVQQVAYPDFPYADFYDARPPAVCAETEPVLQVEIVPRFFPVPASPPDFRAGRNWVFWSSPEERLICAGLQADGTARYACRWPRDAEACELFVGVDAQQAPLRYPIDQILTWALLAQAGGVLMHAALIEKDGVAFALTGASGAGKSTLSGLAHQQGWNILNDDRSVLYTATGWQAAGSPWHGSGAYAQARVVPLAGICFLRQDAGCRAVAMAPEQALRDMLNVVSVPWFDEAWSNAVLRILERLAGEVPCRNFYFNRSLAAVDLLARCAAHATSGATGAAHNGTAP
jgi:hypothetical protein